jgi:hypothetical protein
VKSGEWTRRAGSTRRISDGYEDFSCVDGTAPGSMLVGDETLVSVLVFLCDFGAMLTSVSVVSSATVAVGVSSETSREIQQCETYKRKSAD